MAGLYQRGRYWWVCYYAGNRLIRRSTKIPIRIVMSLARHKDLKTTLRYAHLSPEQVTGAGFINCRKL